jgi:hypothetical protein
MDWAAFWAIYDAIGRLKNIRSTWRWAQLIFKCWHVELLHGFISSPKLHCKVAVLFEVCM